MTHTKPELEVKQGDTAPVLSYTLEDKDGAAIDVSSANRVAFYMAHRATDTNRIVDDAANVSNVTDGSDGEVEYQFDSTDFSSRGRHIAEFEIEYSDGRIQRVPTGPDSYIAIDVGESIASSSASEVKDDTLTLTSLTADSVTTEDLNVTVKFVNAYATSGDGSATNKWQVEYNDILDDIPADARTAVLWHPPGHYEGQSRVELKKGIRQYDDDNATAAWTFPFLAGPDPWCTRIYVPDSLNDHFLYYDLSSDVGTDENVLGGGTAGLYFDGNTANNTSGDVIHIAQRPDNGHYTHMKWFNTYTRRAAERNFHIAASDVLESDWVLFTANRASSENMLIAGTCERLQFSRCRFNFAGGAGIDVKVRDTRFSGCRFRDNDNQGSVCRAGSLKAIFDECHWIHNSITGDNEQIYHNGVDGRYSGNIDTGGNSTDAFKTNGGATDTVVDFVVEQDAAAYNISSPSGERVKAKGVIGGGRIGGADIGSLTGAVEGDIARSKGTNASATADELFILKASGDWQSIADPTTTITPA